MGSPGLRYDALSQRQNGEVRVYESLEPSSLCSGEDCLGRVFGYAGRATPDCEFTTSNGAGMYFSNRTEIRSRRVKRHLPKDSAEATRAATEFVGIVNRASYGRFGLRFFPPSTRDYSCQRVLHPGGHMDHWLVRFKVYLRPDRDQENALVLNARLDMRIGDRGSPIEFFTNWRPVVGTRRAKEYVVAVPVASGTSTSQQRPQLVYLLPLGESNFVAPYYLEASRRVFVPACEYSEQVRIFDVMPGGTEGKSLLESLDAVLDEFT